MLKQFDDVFHMLAENPDTGVTCDFIKQGYRKFPNGSHVIFYRLTEIDSIQIIRILHMRMDVARQLASGISNYTFENLWYRWRDYRFSV